MSSPLSPLGTRISQFIQEHAKDNADPVVVLSDLLERQVVEDARVDWFGTACRVGFKPNDALPELSDAAAELFVATAHGRPVGCWEGVEEDEAVVVAWEANGWCWRFILSEFDIAQSVPAAAALMAELDGSPTATLSLVAGDVPFDMKVRVEGDEFCVEGELDGSEFVTRCARAPEKLLGAIQDVHLECAPSVQ